MTELLSKDALILVLQLVIVEPGARFVKETVELSSNDLLVLEVHHRIVHLVGKSFSLELRPSLVHGHERAVLVAVDASLLTLHRRVVYVSLVIVGGPEVACSCAGNWHADFGRWGPVRHLHTAAQG